MTGKSEDSSLLIDEICGRIHDSSFDTVIHSVVKVKPLPDHHLYLEFDDGAERIFDFRPYLSYPVCEPLNEQSVFEKVEICDGTVSWFDGEFDMAEETLYNESLPAECYMNSTNLCLVP